MDQRIRLCDRAEHYFSDTISGGEMEMHAGD
jgi:hypothetical protein